MNGTRGTAVNYEYPDITFAVKTMLTSIRDLMKNAGWPVEQAMAVLDVPEAERPKYLELLENG